MLIRGGLEMNEEVRSVNAPLPTGSYSQGVKNGPFLFISGQDGVLLDGTIAGSSLKEQTTACLKNIESVLVEAGGTLENIVHMTCHLADLSDENVSEFNKAYSNYFSDVKVKPARITVGSQLMESEVEITAIAYLG